MIKLVSRRAVRFLAFWVAICCSAPFLVAAEEVSPLAIKGYDPVAYFTVGKPVLGLPKFEHQWDEHIYRFSNADHKAKFIADPIRYAPHFAHLCAMALTEGSVVEADPKNWLVKEGKLFLFGKPIGPDLFEKDYAENLEKARRNRQLVKK